MKLNWQLQEDLWLSAVNHDAKYYINACCGKHKNPWIDYIYANEKKILSKKCIVSPPPPSPFIFIIILSSPSSRYAISFFLNSFSVIYGITIIRNLIFRIIIYLDDGEWPLQQCSETCMNPSILFHFDIHMFIWINDMPNTDIERNIDRHRRWCISLSRILEFPLPFYIYHPKTSENIRSYSVYPKNNIFVANCPYFKSRFPLKIT